MKATILFGSLIVFIYFYFAVAQIYIPTKELTELGFSWSNPSGIITYPFAHVGLKHLFANLVVFLPIAYIVERKLNFNHFSALFFFSGAAGAIAFETLYPNAYLVGASAAISGLIAVAIFIDLKKSLIALIVSSLAIYFMAPLLEDYTKQKYESLSKDVEKIENQTKEINKEIEIAISQNKTEEVKVLRKKYAELTSTLNQTINLKVVVGTGIEREKQAKSSVIVHLCGAIVGITYLFSFRQDIIDEFLENFRRKYGRVFSKRTSGRIREAKK
ncbi:MAG: rhomboid family intramembrane serine protease [archaeon]